MRCSSAVQILPKRPVCAATWPCMPPMPGDFQTAEERRAAVQEPSDPWTLAGIRPVGTGTAGRGEEHVWRWPRSVRGGASWSVAGLGDLALYEGRFADAVGFRQGATADLEAKNPERAARSCRRSPMRN